MTMFFSTVRTGKVNELRNSWHSGWWPVKIALFMVCSLISVLAPSWWIQIYVMKHCRVRRRRIIWVWLFPFRLRGGLHVRQDGVCRLGHTSYNEAMERGYWVDEHVGSYRQ
uniref:Uncharacterized protein n=2 Tax=Zea mays TaxID=4577 RepID=A0A804PWB7_MAIZE